MNTLEDLYTLKRLLYEFEFPVSPILEYAIKNKEEELMALTSKAQNETFIEAQNEENTLNADTKSILKRSSSLKIYRNDGSCIEETKAATTMVKAIKEIGAEKIFNMRIPLDGMHLVTKGGNPQYPSAQHDVGNGLFVNVHSNTKTKKRQLEKIFKALGLNWRVEIIEQ